MFAQTSFDLAGQIDSYRMFFFFYSIQCFGFITLSVDSLLLSILRGKETLRWGCLRTHVHISYLSLVDARAGVCASSLWTKGIPGAHIDLFIVLVRRWERVGESLLLFIIDDIFIAFCRNFLCPLMCLDALIRKRAVGSGPIRTYRALELVNLLHLCCVVCPIDRYMAIRV